jgi:hypothetical protein
MPPGMTDEAIREMLKSWGCVYDEAEEFEVSDYVVPTPTPTRKKLVEVTVDGRKFMRLE